MPATYSSVAANWLPLAAVGVSLPNSAPVVTMTPGFGLETDQASGNITITVVGTDATHDAEGDPCTFTFPAMTAGASTGPRKPATSAATLAGSGASRSFTPDVVGTYVVQGYATDDGGAARGVTSPTALDSNVVECVIDVVPPPVAGLAGVAGAKAAIGYFTGNNPTPSPGGSGAREKLESFETDLGRPHGAGGVGFASSNLHFLSTNSSLGACTTNADDTITSPSAHGLTNRDTVHMSSPTSTTVGIQANRGYWAVPVDGQPTKFKLATQKDGAGSTFVNITGTATVTIQKHNFLGTAMNIAATLRTEWATRPDVEQELIFHYYSVPNITPWTQANVEPAYRRARRLEIIAGSWDTRYEALFDLFHTIRAGVTYDGTWFNKSAHGQKVGEKVTISAKTGSIPVTLLGTYYVVASEAARFKLSATAGGAAISGGSTTGDCEVTWRFNCNLRMSHEGELSQGGGYPDGRYWDASQSPFTALVADDEVKCLDSWAHVITLARAHGFKTTWAGDDPMFTKIKLTPRMPGYAAAFPGDERLAYVYGLPVPFGTYFEALDRDTYWDSHTSGQIAALNANLNALKNNAIAHGAQWSISEFGIFFFQRPGFTVTSVDAATDIFTTSTAHGLSEGNQVVVGFNATAPGGITVRTVKYFARAVTATTFKLATTNSDATIVNITSSIGTALNGTASTLKAFKWLGVSEAEAEEWVRAVFAFIELCPDSGPGSCRYVNYFWVGPDSGINSTDLKTYAPAAWAALFSSATGTYGGAI